MMVMMVVLTAVMFVNVTVELRLELFTKVYFTYGIFVELPHHDIDQVMVVDFSIVVQCLVSGSCFGASLAPT